jgi:hypothetical protein
MMEGVQIHIRDVSHADSVAIKLTATDKHIQALE